MKEIVYDNPVFYRKYSQMERSKKGLEGAGEWHALKNLLPDFKNKRVLDLGCGFGWHCRWADAHGALSVVGVELSKKMLQKAREMTHSDRIEYLHMPLEEYHYPKQAFDVVMSSLVFHYVNNETFLHVCQSVWQTLTPNGDFVFSVEHPVFTAYGPQEWYCDAQGNILHWPVDRYFDQGERSARFLGQTVCKYHRTLTTYFQTLLGCGFQITNVVEPMPQETMLQTIPGMQDELRRPMMLIVSAKKAG